MIDVAATGGLIAAGAYGALALALATRWRAKVRGSFLIPAVVITAAWSVLESYFGGEPGPVRLAVEVLKSLAWIVFLRRTLARAGERSLPRTLRFGPLAAVTLTLLIALWAATIASPPLSVSAISHIWALAGLAMALFGFAFVEQALRNTRPSETWAAKFIWVGVAAVFAYDIALFSTSYAIGYIAPGLLATRGLALSLTAPLLAVGVSRIRGIQPQQLMSPRLAFYAASMLVAGVYISAVAFVAWYVRVVGGFWGTALQILFVFAAALGLVVVLLSGVARARIRVTLAKHLFPYTYDYRKEWLDLTFRLSRSASGWSLAERTLEAFKHMTHSPAGAVFALRDESLQHSAGDFLRRETGFAERTDTPFCRFLADREWIVDLDRARAADGPDRDVPVPAWLLGAADAWLAVPLVHEATLYAIVVLRRPHDRQHLTWEDLDLLRTAARQAASYFAFEVAGDALARERQFAAMNRTTAFLMHDFSNIYAQQLLIVENAARHKTNPAFIDDAIATIDNTVKRMGVLLEQFRAGSSSGAPRRIALAEVCAAVVERAASREPRPSLRVTTPDTVVRVAPERLEHVLEHVVRNAQDATPPDGSVQLVVRAVGDTAEVEVADSGVGMDAEFVRTRLFRPFDTTKGAKGMGVGAFQVREFARACGGDVSVSSVPGAGTSFVIRLPRVN